MKTKIKIKVLNVTMPNGNKFKQYMIEDINGKTVNAPTFSSVIGAKRWAIKNGYILTGGK